MLSRLFQYSFQYSFKHRDVEGNSFPGYRRNISEDIRFNRAVTPSILCANKQHVTIFKKKTALTLLD